MKRRTLGYLAFGLVAVLAAAVPGIARPARADAFVDPIVTPVSAYAIDVPSSLLVAATEGVSANGIGSGQLGAMLANSARFDSDWILTAVGQTMGGSTTTAPPDIADLSAAERAQFEALVSDFEGAPATKLAGFTKVVGGKAIPIAGAVLMGVQLGGVIDRAAGVDVDGGLCAGGPNFGFQVVDAVLAGLTSADCDAWRLSQQLAAARNQDTTPTVTATAIGSTSCLGSNCASIASVSFVAPSDYSYCIVWNVPSPGTNVVPLGQFLNFGQSWYGGWDYRATSLTFSGSTYCPAPPPGSFASAIAMRLNGSWANPMTTWKVTQSSSATVATVTPPTLTYPDPARTIRCDVTLSTGQVLSASTQAFHEGDATIPRPVYPAIPANAVPTNTQCVETGGPQPLTVSQGTTTSPYQNWRTNEKECGNGSCVTDLRQNGASCFFSTIDCDGWMTDPNRDTDYQCFVGTHAVAISECYIYGTTFNAADRANGHAYADPATGEITDGQTAKSDVDQLAEDFMTRTGSIALASADPATQWSWAFGVAGACLAQYTASLCRDETIWAPGNNIPDIAAHDLAAIAKGQPGVLTYMTGAEKMASGVSRQWYNAPPYSMTGGCAPPKPDGDSCDEYPYFATAQGGPPGGDLSYENAAQNSLEGSWRKAFLRYVCHLDTAAGEDKDFLVVPNPFLYPTIGWCKL